MKQLVLKTLNHQQIIEIEHTPLGSGGEGTVHRILKPQMWMKDFCVKLYYPQFRTSQYEEKIAYMMAHQPQKIREDNYLICWPDGLIYEDGIFVGFRMPFAFTDSETLYELCIPIIRDSLPMEWRAFDRQTLEGMIARAKLCQRLAVPIHRIHELQYYVFVDLKPKNILVTPQGKVALIDLDSIQISDKMIIAHNGRVMTPEYMPPESKTIEPNKECIPLSWDLFSMAVIFYQVLIGLHPFVAACAQRCGDRERECNEIYEKILCGISPYGANANYIETVPKLHQYFEKTLPQSIQQLFIKAFKDGHAHPELRPTAEEWGIAFNEELRRIPYNFFYQTEIMFATIEPTVPLALPPRSFWDRLKAAILRLFFR